MPENLPRVFLDVSIPIAGSQSNEPMNTVGRIIIELRSDLCPNTAENFRCLCTGELGLRQVNEKAINLHFKGCLFHRVVNSFIIQSGDIVANDGTSGSCVSGNLLDEKLGLDLKHDQYVVSMANQMRPNSATSQFFIVCDPQGAHHLDGSHVVFGKIVSGFDFIHRIENIPVDSNYRPLNPIQIVHSGQLAPTPKPQPEPKSPVKRSKRRTISPHRPQEFKRRSPQRKVRKEKFKYEPRRTNPEFAKDSTIMLLNVKLEDDAGRKIKGRGLPRYRVNLPIN